MFWTVASYVLAAVAGGVAVGVLANRWPVQFAKVVGIANAFDDKVNTTAAGIKADIDKK